MPIRECGRRDDRLFGVGEQNLGAGMVYQVAVLDNVTLSAP